MRAVLTRVSTDQGLEQDFNSLDAQYDASQAYIRSQAHAGWSLLRDKYDDGGFSELWPRRQERLCRAQRPGAKIDAIATSVGDRDRTSRI
jgi:hypothetical protein